jgi:CheY-like chemotaxis protein
MSKMIKRLIGEDIEVETYYQKDLWNVMADKAQIEQIIINLVVNARDAMPKGGNLILETNNIFLDESYAKKHDITLTPGEYVMLAITDTGYGMDEDTKSKIFDPFFTTKEKDKGTGLGLSTVYGIVKQSGGYIWVYSEPGEGTTFKIYLPRIEKKLKQPHDEHEAGHSELKGSETILVVEDDEAVLNLIKNILKGHGYRVLTTTKGESAIELFIKHKEDIDLLLTDVVMPGINGKELSETLKRIKPEIKTLFMSGYTSNAIVHHGILEKDIQFIQKPFTGVELLKKIRSIL